MAKFFLGYPTLSKWMFTCFIQSKSRDDIMATLMANGYTRKQAVVFYRNYWLRFVAYRKKLASQDVDEE
jgi:hypothetical protein